MVAMVLTLLTAIAAVFIMVLVWVGIDRLAHRSLGERNRCCHSFDAEEGDRAAGCCGKHESCVLKDEESGRPAYTIRQ